MAYLVQGVGYCCYLVQGLSPIIITTRVASVISIILMNLLLLSFLP